MVTRFLAQNGLTPIDEAALGALADELSALGGAVSGEGEIPDDVVKACVARLLAALAPPRPELANLAKQLVKGCYQPDYPQCRESYHETNALGRCRRQELANVLTRVSGTHCVDCPYWREWSPEEHTARLAAEWKDGAAAFAAHREVFLPGDFRVMRRLAQARV